MNQPNLLAQLKDIHQPAPVSWWPPAIGWYILTALIFTVCFLVGKFIYKKWRKYYRKKYALRQFKELKFAYQNNPDVTYIAQASILLKRVIMTKYARKQVASLTGEQWLIFLDSIDKSNNYSQGIGRELLYLPYKKNAEPVNALFIVMENTMRRCL